MEFVPHAVLSVCAQSGFVRGLILCDMQTQVKTWLADKPHAVKSLYSNDKTRTWALRHMAPTDCAWLDENRITGRDRFSESGRSLSRIMLCLELSSQSIGMMTEEEYVSFTSQVLLRNLPRHQTVIDVAIDTSADCVTFGALISFFAHNIKQFDLTQQILRCIRQNKLGYLSDLLSHDHKKSIDVTLEAVRTGNVRLVTDILQAGHRACSKSFILCIREKNAALLKILLDSCFYLRSTSFFELKIEEFDWYCDILRSRE